MHQSFYSFYLGSNWDEQNVIKSSGRYIEKYMFLLRGNKPADAPYVAGEFYGEVIKLPIHLLTRFENINLVLTAPHPSPLSSYRGFFGCKQFSEANKYLMSKKHKPRAAEIKLTCSATAGTITAFKLPKNK